MSVYVVLSEITRVRVCQSWNWSCGWLRDTTWVLGTEPGSFVGAAELQLLRLLSNPTLYIMYFNHSYFPLMFSNSLDPF